MAPLETGVNSRWRYKSSKKEGAAREVAAPI